MSDNDSSQSPGHAVALEGRHPQTATYLRVAALLAVITAIELVVFYLPSMRPVITPVLLLLSASKFSLVVAFFMHLRFDSRLYRFFFVLALFVAIVVLLAVITINGSYRGPIPGAG
jgi:cytochrome c oxidase subunit 4